MTRWNRRQRRKVRGFTLVELMVVVAIVLIVAVVALPNILQGMRLLRLRSNASSIATLLQQERMRAVRDNRTYQLIARNDIPGMNGNMILFVDGTMGPASFNGNYDRGEPLTVLARDVTISAVSPIGAPNVFIQTAMAPGAGGGGLALRVSTAAAPGPTFNPRGIPCEIPGGAFSTPVAQCPTVAAGQPIGYVIYLQSTTVPNDGWSAVTASPGGRIRSWVYTPQTNARWR